MPLRSGSHSQLRRSENQLRDQTRFPTVLYAKENTGGESGEVVLGFTKTLCFPEGTLKILVGPQSPIRGS